MADLPFLALIAVAARPGPSLFALCVFGVAFVLLSFGGQKSWRYLFFAMPFLFVIWAIALASLWPSLAQHGRGRHPRGVQPHGAPVWRQVLRWPLIVGSFAFLVLANGSTARTFLRPFGFQLGEGRFTADFPLASDALAPYVRDADVVLSSNELLMLYYFDRVDIVVSKERLAKFADIEFPRNRGRPPGDQSPGIARFHHGLLFQRRARHGHYEGLASADRDRRGEPRSLIARR